MTKKLKKILYIEDDEDIAQITVMTLEEFGKFEVQHCISGINALQKLPKFLPQLVLMDMMIPGMDGLETLSRMKEIEVIKNIPVIFMTAKMQAKEQQSYLDAGAIGVIAKPFDPEKLCDIINQMWQRNNVR